MKKVLIQNPTLNLIYSCDCKAQLQLQIADGELLMVDTRINGRHRWIGLVLQPNDVFQLKKFLESNYPKSTPTPPSIG